MAIPEACGLWIEQRVQEELERKGDTGASLREIGRVVAAEVEKYFEARVNPMTITNRASKMNRQSVSNATPEQPTETTKKTPAQGAHEMTPEDIANEVEMQIPKTGSISSAARNVAKKVGRTEGGVRRIYQREKSKVSGEGVKLVVNNESHDKNCPVSHAKYFANIAIRQMQRIRNDDPEAPKELKRVQNWISRRIKEI